MKRGRLPAAAESRREMVEKVLLDLTIADDWLEDRTTLRLQQAIRRDASLGGLLEPALQELEQVRRWIVEAHAEFKAVWDAGQLDRWVMEDGDER